MKDIAADLPPIRLYKYRGLDKDRADGVPYERDRSIIVDCKLWAGSPLGFNDPFDCYPVMSLEGTQEEKIAWVGNIAPQFGLPVHLAMDMIEQALNNPSARDMMSEWRDNVKAIGVVSLTEQADDMLMWAHYANSHQGYCLEFDAAILPISLAYRVEYSIKRPVFRIFDPNRADIIQRTLLQKAQFWQHEREWRVVQPSHLGPLCFPPQGIKSVIFGASIGIEDEEKLRQIAAEREVPLSFKRARLDRLDYRMEIIDA